MEANTGHRSQLDHDSAAPGLVAPEDPDFHVGPGADGKEDVSKPQSPPPVLLLLLLHQTCHYQRNDSPVEALILSPEPLSGEGEERKGKRKQRGKEGKKEGVRGEEQEGNIVKTFVC